MTEEVKSIDEEHYEVVSEYRIGEGAPPPFLVICFISDLHLCRGFLGSLLWLLEDDVT